MDKGESRPSFAKLVQTFFSEHLTQQRALSPRTVAAYRDTFVLFLDFAQHQIHKMPTDITLTDVTPALIVDFLDHLETERKNATRTRNARLSALRAFLKFAGRQDISSLHVIQQDLGVPMKRFDRPMLGFLSREEIIAVIGDAGDDWLSQRDHLMLTLLYNTGARVSEITGILVRDIELDGAACVHLRGKGRKKRTVPLWRSSVKAIRAWLRRNPDFQATTPLLPSIKRQRMTRSNVFRRVALRVAIAARKYPALAHRKISPHTFRHSTAMGMLQAGVDITVIALWLGHENTNTTHQYVEVNLDMKTRALDRLEDPETEVRRYRAPDSLREFLRTL